MSDFEAKFSNLIASEMIAARCEHDRQAAILECLGHAIGTTVALIAAGNRKLIDELLAGNDAYAHSIAVDATNALDKIKGVN